MNKKLGYYKIGRVELESKIQACILATHLSKKSDIAPNRLIRWIFNEDVFKNFDWSIEPEESLDQLYNQRAKEIREKYDYVIVSYSGGADSHNVVMSFLRQGLHIDEILVNCLDKGTANYAVVDPSVKDAKFAHASEHQLQAIPRIKDILVTSPSTKITVFDMTDHLFEAFSSDTDNWVLKMREEMNPVDVTRYNYIYNKEFRKTVDKDKKICVVLGIEKPRVLIDEQDDSVYLRFVDRLTNISPVGEYMKEYSNTTVEYFYWSPDACKLLSKQAHVVKKWLEWNKQIQPFFHMRPKLSTLSSFRRVNERLLRPILYSTWDYQWFQADKGLNDWHTEFDSWFIEGHANSKQYQIWKNGLNFVSSTARPFTVFNGFYFDGLIPFYEDYLIGKLYNGNNLSL